MDKRGGDQYLHVRKLGVAMSAGEVEPNDQLSNCTSGGSFEA